MIDPFASSTCLTFNQNAGFATETVRYADIEFVNFDIGLGMWKTHRHFVHQQYYPDCVGCIFVLDSNDEAKFGDVKQGLAELFEDGDCGVKAGVPVVVLANKDDIAVRKGDPLICVSLADIYWMQESKRSEDLISMLALDNETKHLWVSQ